LGKWGGIDRILIRNVFTLAMAVLDNYASITQWPLSGVQMALTVLAELFAVSNYEQGQKDVTKQVVEFMTRWRSFYT
jgi:hypothetical protein